MVCFVYHAGETYHKMVNIYNYFEEENGKIPHEKDKCDYLQKAIQVVYRSC